MSIESKRSEHWTDEQLIEHIYGIGPSDGHLVSCAECQERLGSFRKNREAIERNVSDSEVPFEYLAAQRREIYARLTTPERWWSGFRFRRWAPVAATLVMLSGGFVFYESSQHQPNPKDNISDEQLAQEVSQIANGPEAQPIAPLQELFEE